MLKLTTQHKNDFIKWLGVQRIFFFLISLLLLKEYTENEPTHVRFESKTGDTVYKMNNNITIANEENLIFACVHICLNETQKKQQI